MVAVSSNIDSLHRMTREERDLHGVIVNGSDHLTAYNLYAEAVNQHGYLGEVYGLPRHLFEDGLAEWAERRGVLVKAIEDTALGVASVYRSLELPLPKQLPYASKESEARVGRSARAVHAVRPRDRRAHRRRPGGAGLEDLGGGKLGRRGGQPAILRRPVRRASRRRSRAPRSPTIWCASTPALGPPRVVLGGPAQAPGARGRAPPLLFRFRPRHRRRAAAAAPSPKALRSAPRDVLAECARRRRDDPSGSGPRHARTIAMLDELWRRSGGDGCRGLTRRRADPIRQQLERVDGWENFQRTSIALDPAALVDAATRERLDALPAMVRASRRRRAARLRGGGRRRASSRVRSARGPGQATPEGRAAGARPPAPLRGAARPARAGCWPTRCRSFRRCSARAAPGRARGRRRGPPAGRSSRVAMQGGRRGRSRPPGAAASDAGIDAPRASTHVINVHPAVASRCVLTESGSLR